MFISSFSFDVSLINNDAIDAPAKMNRINISMFVVSSSIQGSTTPLKRPKLMQIDIEVPLTSVGNYSSELTVKMLYKIWRAALVEIVTT